MLSRYLRSWFSFMKNRMSGRKVSQNIPWYLLNGVKSHMKPSTRQTRPVPMPAKSAILMRTDLGGMGETFLSTSDPTAPCALGPRNRDVWVRTPSNEKYRAVSEKLVRHPGCECRKFSRKGCFP